MANESHSTPGTQRGGSGNFANDPQRASEAGRKGGQMSGGNFAHNPARASEAGRKGGQRSHAKNRQPEESQSPPPETNREE